MSSEGRGRVERGEGRGERGEGEAGAYLSKMLSWALKCLNAKSSICPT